MQRTAKETQLERLRTLAEFRFALRQFLQFSEQAAEAAGLHPQQHQLLLQIAGAAEGRETTVSYVAERLNLRHHSVVELSKRCEESGFIKRRQGITDRRNVVLQVTSAGNRVLRRLSNDHARELSDLLPWLLQTLQGIHSSGIEPGSAKESPSRSKGKSK